MIRRPRRLVLVALAASAALGLAAPGAVAGATAGPPTVTGTSAVTGPIPGGQGASSSDSPPVCLVLDDGRDVCFSSEPYWDLLAELVRSL